MMDDPLKMFSPEGLDNLAESSRKFLTTDPADKELLSAAEQALAAAMKVAEESEHLARYREIAARMPSRLDVSFEPPNFPYSVHRA